MGRYVLLCVSNLAQPGSVLARVAALVFESMAPKSVPVSNLGASQPCRDGWRVQAKISGRTEFGPKRSSKEDADRDLAWARQASDREAMQERLQGLRKAVASAAEGAAVASASNRASQDQVPGEATKSQSPHFEASQPSGSSSVAQPAAGASQQQERTNSSGSSGVEQHIARSKAEEDTVGAALGAGGVEAAGEARAQARKRPAAALDEQDADHSGSVSAGTTSADDQKVLLLQLKRPHYDAMKAGRKLWEARPMYQLSKNGWRESVHMRLGTVGRVARLQSGANTNDRVRIAEVRRYGGVEDMVEDLGAQLLPDAADADARVKVYEELYADEDQRACGFVAMRLV